MISSVVQLFRGWMQSYTSSMEKSHVSMCLPESQRVYEFIITSCLVYIWCRTACLLLRTAVELARIMASNHHSATRK